MKLALVHVDDALIVVDKPAGMLSVPGRGADKQDCAWTRVCESHPGALVVHRLDMATSGLLLFARNVDAQRRLSIAFADRAVTKRYTAVVHGRVEPGDAQIDLPLAADWPNRPLQKVDLVSGKPSSTRYSVLSHDEASGTTRLLLEPITGRSHQLRVHLLAIGHPIVGDALYGSGLASSDRLLLHACELLLPHPATEAEIAFQSNPAF